MIFESKSEYTDLSPQNSLYLFYDKACSNITLKRALTL